jgi:hypothetical protein
MTTEDGQAAAKAVKDGEVQPAFKQFAISVSLGSGSYFGSWNAIAAKLSKRKEKLC